MATISNSVLAQKVSDLLDSWRTRELEMRAWMSGAADGGDYGDGRFPLTDYLGVVRYTYSPAALESSVGVSASSAESSATAAAASAAAAAAALGDTEAARDEGEGFRDGAQAARDLAEMYKNQSAASAAAALSYKNDAGGSADAAAGSASDAQDSADAAASSDTSAGAHATAAAASAAAAAASALAAATFNPALYAPLAGASFTGHVSFASNDSQLRLNSSGAASNAKNVLLRHNTSGQFAISSASDGSPGSASRNLLAGTRSGTSWTAVTFGNGTDNPTYTFAGTGAASFGGTVFARQYVLDGPAASTKDFPIRSDGVYRWIIRSDGNDDFTIRARANDGADLGHAIHITRLTKVAQFAVTPNVNGTDVSLVGHAHSGADITSGTVADARLSTNVPLKNAAAVITAAYRWGGAPQSNTFLSARGNLNAFEFGHNNAAGYASTLGHLSNSGAPFLAFHAEHGSEPNTYRTRGKIGNIITTNVAGSLLIGRAANADADAQTLSTDLTISSSGATFAGTLANTGTHTVNAVSDGVTQEQRGSAGKLRMYGYSGGSAYIQAHNLASSSKIPLVVDTSALALNANTTISGSCAVFSGTSTGLAVTTSSASPWGITLTRSDAAFSSSVYNDGARWAFQHTPAVGSTAVSLVGHTHAATDIASGTLADARLSSNVPLKNATAAITAAWTFSSQPTFASKGAFPYYDNSAYASGKITVSTSAASGTPADGDLWFQYT